MLVTAGPTREALDPVRYITNHSSGKMGYAIARAAAMRGARVTLVSGPTALPEPLGVDFVPVQSAQDMSRPSPPGRRSRISSSSRRRGGLPPPPGLRREDQKELQQ